MPNHLVIAVGVGGVAFIFWSAIMAYWKSIPRCECCGTMRKLEWCNSCTMYHWDGKGEDPNRDRLYCPQCAESHFEYWADMWNDYYSGCM